MKRHSLSSSIFIVALLLLASLAFWAPLTDAHDMDTSFDIVENTRGPIKFDAWTYTYSIDSTDSDSTQLEMGAVQTGANDTKWQELQFKSQNIPDYENPADADSNNVYDITLALESNIDGSTHTHDITISVTDVAAPSKMSAPTLEAQVTGDVKVSWTAVSHSALTGYEVDWTNTDDSSDTGSGTAGSSVTWTTIIHTLLTDGATYNIKIRALSSEGNSPWSDTASVTTLSTEEPLDSPDDPQGDEDPLGQLLAADVLPGLSSELVAILSESITMDSVIFNELFNGSTDTQDWLELRNVSDTDVSLDDWGLTLITVAGEQVLTFPVGTMLPAGEVLLLVNTDPSATDADIPYLVTEGFLLPASDFTLLLSSPSGYEDAAGNYFVNDGTITPRTAMLTLDQAWYRLKPAVIGYRPEAWTASATVDGTPGQRVVLLGDVNGDGIVNILDLVLVASQFGETGETPADVNGDGTVNVQDLVSVANAWNSVAAAPSGTTASAQQVQAWLALARQGVTPAVQASLPDGFSYERGIQTLEQLVQALAPKETALLANYPNPFNPETWIPYQLAQPADVTVRIYAATGAVVRTLDLGHQVAGRYQSRGQAAYWDGRNAFGETVASGLYFYTLTAGDFTATRKMLIQK